MAIKDHIFKELPSGYRRASHVEASFYSAPGVSEAFTQLSVQINAAPLRDSLPAAFSSDIYTRQLYPDTPYFSRNMPPSQQPAASPKTTK